MFTFPTIVLDWCRTGYFKFSLILPLFLSVSISFSFWLAPQLQNIKQYKFHLQMQGDQVANSIDYILNSELSGVLSKGFAQLNQKRPDFPVSYLASWLREYSKNQKDKISAKQLVSKQSQAYAQLEKTKVRHSQNRNAELKKQSDLTSVQDKKFFDQIQKTKHLQDLLVQWIPEYTQKKYKLTGSYVGNLTYSHKPVEATNFEPGAELDTEGPKIIQYTGSSKSHKPVVYMKILPNESGVSYEVFNQPEPEPEPEEVAEGEQVKPKETKKIYKYFEDVTKNEKIFYFKYPKLGSYACFPLKLNSFLSQKTFDQGINIYKQYVKQKEEAQKQYTEKLNELKNQFEETKKRYEEFQVPQDDTEALASKNGFNQQMDKAQEACVQFQKNPLNFPLPDFPITQKLYMLGIDTLGQDRKISEEDLNKIESEVLYFKKKFEEKQRQMLMNDILSYIEDEAKTDQLQNSFKQIQKNAISNAEQIAKQKTNKQKQQQHEISVAKCKKMESVFDDAVFEKSRQNLFSYNIPKYKEIIQIGLMLVRYDPKDINLPRSNELDHRKVYTTEVISKFLQKLKDYDLRPQSTETCKQEYKISKLHQRLQKIDLEQVLKYNVFLWILANHIKGICWCLMHCRDSHIQAYEFSVKAKEERDAEITKFAQQLEKALEAHKTQLGEEVEAFKEEEWRQYYKKQNQQPQPLQIIEKKQFLDLE